LAAGQIVEAITPFVANPVAVDRFVNSRFEPRDAVLIGLDANIAAGAAAGTDRRGLIKIPNPDFETKIAVGERADRTDIDDVGRQRIVEHSVRKQTERATIAERDARSV